MLVFPCNKAGRLISISVPCDFFIVCWESANVSIFGIFHGWGHEKPFIDITTVATTVMAK